jgi:hypothetical protein
VDIKGKAMESMLRMAIGTLGIDADSLLANIRSFQEYCTNAIQHHDKRLVALESNIREVDEKLARVLAILEKEPERLFDSGDSDGRAMETGEPEIPGTLTAASNEYYRTLNLIAGNGE